MALPAKMANLTISVPPGMDLPAAFSDIPAPVKTLLKRGFAGMAQLSAAGIDQIIPLVTQAVGGGQPRISADLAARVGLGEDATESVLSAASLMASVLIIGGISTEALLSALSKEGILEEPIRLAVAAFADRLALNREELGAQHKRYELANETFPSLRKFSASIDLRVGFDADKVAFVVPVILAHLRTDAAHEEVWFQMTKEQLGELLNQFEGLRKRLEEAERSALNINRSER